jgi:hypothetical protein
MIVPPSAEPRLVAAEETCEVQEFTIIAPVADDKEVTFDILSLFQSCTCLRLCLASLPVPDPVHVSVAVSSPYNRRCHILRPVR